MLEEECNKHPNLYLGMNARNLAMIFPIWNYDLKKEIFVELIDEYSRQAKGDAERGRLKLSKGLRRVSSSLEIFLEFFTPDNKPKIVSTGVPPKKFAEMFGNTNYYYQLEFFKYLQPEMHKSFETVTNSMQNVCNTCKPYLKNPYK